MGKKSGGRAAAFLRSEKNGKALAEKIKKVLKVWLFCAKILQKTTGFAGGLYET